MTNGKNRATKWINKNALSIFAILIIILLLIIVSRTGFRKAENIYVPQIKALEQQLSIERTKVAKLEAENAIPDYSYEARMMAQLLYGVKDNNNTDLQTLCWCILNRVDSPGYPNTIQEVISQPNQWIGYNENNPVIDNLYNISIAVINYWAEGHRPCDTSFVYMNWSPTLIMLRDSFKENKYTQYWAASGITI